MNLESAEKRRIMRMHLWGILHDGKGRIGKIFNFGLIILILISVALIPLEFIPGFRHFDEYVHILEAVIVSLFTVEYLLRIYAAPHRIAYIFSFFGIIDLLSIMPFYAGIFGTEYIRIVRFIRLLKIAEIEASAQQDDVSTMQKDIGLMDGEEVQRVITKSPIVLILGMIPSFVSLTFGLGIILTFQGYVAISIGVSLFLFSLTFLWKTWLDYSYDVIYLTNYRLIFQNQHLLGRSINQVNYISITNVKPYYPNPLSYVLRYGSLVIDTAAENPGQIGLHTVRKHEQAAHMIMEKCFAAQTRQSSAVITQLQGGM